MCYTYVIKSKNTNWVYVGNTEDMERRFDEHNNGFVKSTKAYKPFKLLFVQIVENRKEARNIEKFLKVRLNKESLLKLF